MFKLNLLRVSAQRVGIQSSRENGEASNKAASFNGRNNAEIAAKKIKIDVKLQHMKQSILRLQTFMRVKILTEKPVADVKV